MPIDPQALYVQLGRLAEGMPNLAQSPRASAMQWLGRAHALVSRVDVDEGRRFQSAIDNLINSHSLNVDEKAGHVMFIFYRVLTAVELQAPAATQGAFIPAGNVFDAMAAVGKVLATARSDLLIVDPYMDERTLTDFAPLASASVSIRLLTDVASYKQTLRAASQRWIAQNGPARPLTAKLSPARTLHDRLIAVDEKEIWILTQSLNGFAARAPASLVRVDQETAGLKLLAYKEIWNTAKPL
jgi:hypothetical protein